MLIRTIAILIGTLTLLACSSGDDAPEESIRAKEQPEQAAPSRPIVSSKDDINVDVISVQYGPKSKYVGQLAFNVGTGRPRLPDPQTEIFIVVVREPPTEVQMANFNLQLKTGYAYQWLGGTDFHEIMPVDLALSDDEISKVFGVGRPSDGQRLVDMLDNKEIDVAEALEFLEGLDNVNYRSASGLAAIHRAAYWGHFDIVKELVRRGADVNLPGMGGGRPLQSAAAGGEPEILKFLIDAGADIDALDTYKETALHSAMYNEGCVACAKILIANGLDPHQPNVDGATPISIAKDQPASIMKNKEDMVAYLGTLESALTDEQ
jgi:ankyrin repeat protein